MLEEIPIEYKVVTLGESGVGKTSLVNYLINGSFDVSISPTIGAGYIKSTILVDGKPVILNIWDTAGQEKFHSLIPLYIRNAQAFLIVFDLNDNSSFQALDQLMDTINSSPTRDVHIVLCGNKLDLLEPGTSMQTYESYAQIHQMTFMTASAKTGQGVQLLFSEIADAVYRNNEKPNKLQPELDRDPKPASNSDCSC